MDSITEWIMLQKANNLGAGTLETYRKTLERVDSWKSIGLNKLTKKDLVEFFATYKMSDSTKLLTSIVVKKYYRDQGKTELVDWIKVQKPDDNFDPNDVLTPEDISALIQATDNHYFKALFSFLWDTGSRISEAKSIKWKDLIDTTDGFEVHIPTKKTKAGYRRVFLAESSKFIRNLQHIAHAKADDIIFGLKYRYEIKVLEQAGKDANITKPLTFHKFRHGRVTYLKRMGIDEDTLRRIMGWTATSTVPARYKHATDDDSIAEQKRVLGNGDGHVEPPKPKRIVQPETLKLTNLADTLFELREKLDTQSQRNEELQKTVDGLLKDLANKGATEEVHEMREAFAIQQQKNEQLEKQMKGMQDFMQKLISQLPPELVQKVKVE